MAYDTKKLFRNAISNVAKDFGSLYSGRILSNDLSEITIPAACVDAWR